jgi:hypothetical protein
MPRAGSSAESNSAVYSWALLAQRAFARGDCYDVRLFQKETSMAKAKGRAVRAWSKEDVKNLRAFAKEKLSAGRAAKKLRRTRGAVAQKAMKLRIRFRSIRKKAR